LVLRATKAYSQWVPSSTISGYHCEVDTNCSLLGYYKAGLDPRRWDRWVVPKCW